MYGWARREHRNVAVRLSSITSSHSVSVNSTAGLRAARPALFTRMSISPRRSKAALTASSSVTSQPSARSSDTARAPCARSSATVAAPMPFAPPVTTAVFAFQAEQIHRFAVSILAAMFDLLIRGALLVDGSGAEPRRGGSRGERRPDRRNRAHQRRGARDRRCRRPCAHAGHHRQPHALRRPDHLGSAASRPRPRSASPPR